MDLQPFYTINMGDLDDQSISYLENFIKSNLDINNILNTASDLKYTSLIKFNFKSLLDNPDDEFVKLILNHGIYGGVKNQKVVEKFKPIVKRAINQYINERMSSKFKETLSNSEKDDEKINFKKEDKIVTTFEEISAFIIVKSILRKKVDVKRIYYRDTESYFGILIDDNNRKWVCRINLDSKNKHIIISDDNKKGVRYELNSIDDIYELETELENSATKYL